ncbi:ribonuclease R family protein [Silvibacterium dinghuense]|uniref:Ribonuclease R n=1 Tax=Silvibacterium dinghuense TaxID=1560006 RepID=A0A4Q1SL39_9BACT|nr:VacB/RNase II family 3'-5' exoribonuclease [Silvibacterium dinghuense]RXS98010.1 VacB/RNase II family 3'-5' exoribonuclease [Silvibacterium dinghuense]GGH03791.1 ribonuclease R [Silvibacterium dinghuense]
MTDRELLRHIERSPGQKAGYKQLVREFSLGGGRERRLLLEHLARLTAAGHLTKVDKEQWAIAKAAAARDNLIAGRLDLHRDGFGFVRPNEGQKVSGEDIFIPPPEIHGAMQGDQVLVELAPARNDGRGDNRKLGRVVRVLTRRNATVVGVFHYATSERAPGNYIRPFDDRMGHPVFIPFDAELPEAAATPHRVLGKEAVAARAYDPDNLEGLVMDVEITHWPTPHTPARGVIREILGYEDDFGVDVEMVIRKHHLPHAFPDNVLEEARAVAHLDAETVAARRDFRALPIVTIDGETARDFDDAVLVELDEETGHWRLQVHIADVAEYVRPDTALDLEARLRGNSVYFPDRAIPMLPQELSTDICSLRPDEDRLVLSCLMNIDPSGNVVDYEVTEGVIRSARRMTYTQVHKILDGDEAVRAEFAPLVPAFERMKQLAEILHHKRDRRGSIDFDLPEPIIEFDEFGAMKSVTRSERNWAHRLIEEFMLSANESVASWIENLSVPSLYRIHEKPEAKRVVEFEEVAASFGYSLGVGNLPVKTFHTRGERRDRHRNGRSDGRSSDRNARGHEVAGDIAITPKMYQKLTAKISGKPEERIVAYLMLRSLKQAKYSERNEGHFALAAPCYTHFTSPIRRYPDLIIHRIVKALLGAGVEGHGVLSPGEPHAKQAKPHKEPALRISAVPKAPAYEVISETDLQLIAGESSANERRAADAERELVEWKKLKFMRDRVGEDFHAMILSATKYGLFVELDDLFVEGLVPIQSLGALDNDYYTWRENTREIIGERWGRKFRIGQRVRVILERIDAQQKRLQFGILLEEEEQAQQSAKGRKGKAKKSATAEAEPSAKKAARKGLGKATNRNPKKGRRKGPVPDFAINVAGPNAKKKSPGTKRTSKPSRASRRSMQQEAAQSIPYPRKKKSKKKK